MEFIKNSFLCGCLLLCACTEPPGDPATATERAPIHYGMPDEDHDSVLKITGPGSCSGALISPSVILTAHHCLHGTSGGLWIAELGQTPPLVLVGEGDRVVLPESVGVFPSEDVAMLILTGPADLPYYVSAVEVDEEELLGAEVTIVGYGQDETGDSGFRQTAVMTVTHVDELALVLEGPAYPGYGDSGGPVFDERGQVIGVISRGGDGYVIVARVDQHRWFVDPAIRRDGGCVLGDPEVCDGIDNDCDGEVDGPECVAAGERCESDEQCSRGSCEEVRGERICTEPCFVTSESSCWDGAYCAEHGSCGEGSCRNGEPGTGTVGEPCSDDLECASLMCRDVGASQELCTDRCIVDALQCRADEVCLGLWDEGDHESGCGGCVPEEQTTDPRGVGEPCDGDGDCRDDLTCVDDPPHRYCSLPCAGHDDCPESMHCRAALGLCIRGELGATGAACAGDDDCASGLCLELPDGAHICSEPCRPGVACPARYSCDFESEVCLPWDAVLGQLCEPDGEVLCADGECLRHGDETRCTRPCDGSFCPSGFECVELVGGDYCWPVVPAGDAESGCSCRVAADGSGALRRGLTRLLPRVF